MASVSFIGLPFPHLYGMQHFFLGGALQLTCFFVVFFFFAVVQVIGLGDPVFEVKSFSTNP